jgi:hypothetical protein
VHTTPTSSQRRRRAARLAAPVAGLLAAGLLVWQGSTAAFTASTDNTGDAWSTGDLVLENNGADGNYGGSTGALFNETLIKPGVSGARCITVRSSGSLPGDLRLYRGALSGTNAANLAANLDVTVDALEPAATDPTIDADCTGYTGPSGGAVFDGTLDALTVDYATAATSTALAGGTEYVVYRIGWAMDASVDDNSLQDSDVTTDLIWEVQ